MEDLEGSITISRPSSDGRKYIQIEIKDEGSRIKFVTVKVKLSDFAEALTGLSYMPCRFNTRGLDIIGKVKEAKTITFKFSKLDYYSDNCEEAAYTELKSICKGMEGDWKGTGLLTHISAPKSPLSM